MPRTARASAGDICYHVINRGNRKATVFHDETDYENFESLMRRACKRLPMRILGWCLMPNHFHLVLFPYLDGDLGRWMHWLLTSQVQAYRRRYGTVGRIWQGRFKAPPIQRDGHLVTVLRYAERNPLRAGLVARTEDWRWSSMRARLSNDLALLSPSPTPLPNDWRAWVNRPLTDEELSEIRTSTRRGRPFGDDSWTIATARTLGLLHTIRRRGRPSRSSRVQGKMSSSTRGPQHEP